MSEDIVPTKKKISFAIGNIGGLAIGQASILLLYAYYFLYLGVPISPLGIGLILMIYGIWDALNEPLIGHLSDITRSKQGRRKPFIAFGIVPLIICSYLIFTPPLHDPLICSIYLIVMLILYETFVTMVITLWYSLFPEITLNEHQRLLISKYLQIFGVIGLILGLGLAPLIAGSFTNPMIGYSTMGLILGIITGFSMLPTLLFIKERKEFQIKKEEKTGFIKSIVVALRNKTFVYFVLMQFLLQVSYSIVLSSLPLFFEGVLGLSAQEWSIYLLLIFVTLLPGLYIWIIIANKRGTKQALFIAMIFFCATFPFVFIVYNALTMLIILLIAGISLGGLMLFPTILLSDVIDEDQLKTHKRQEGIYNGVSGVIVKLSNAISWLLLGIILTIFQIKRENLTQAALTPLNELGLRLLIGIIPTFVILLGMFFLYLYPLTGSRLKEVKEQVKILNEQLKTQI